jgi:micrococcal nuclease
VGAAVSCRDRLVRLALLLLLAWLPAAAAVDAAASPAARIGTVTWVYDADTLEVAPHGTVRLIGIDAPEKTPSERDQTFVKLGVARRRLREVHGEGLAWSIGNVKGRQVSLTCDQPERDRHGRLLAYVRLPDGRLLNRVLLEQGLVIAYRRFAFTLKDEFLAAEGDAQRRGVGLWKR